MSTKTDAFAATFTNSHYPSSLRIGGATQITSVERIRICQSPDKWPDGKELNDINRNKATELHEQIAKIILDIKDGNGDVLFAIVMFDQNGLMTTTTGPHINGRIREKVRKALAEIMTIKY